MQYQGGKARQAKRLADIMLSITDERERYIEPFCGACSVAYIMVPHFQTSVLSDLSQDLILLWKALQNGWEPPSEISFELYTALKNSEPSELRGFAGFAQSFGGKWFGGYAKNNSGTNYAALGRKSLLKRIEHLKKSYFLNTSYTDLIIQPNDIVYCDPPYANTENYKAVKTFDSTTFWYAMKEWSKTACVFVSEFSAPEDWESIFSIERTITLDKSHKQTNEHLFLHKSWLDYNNWEKSPYLIQ